MDQEIIEKTKRIKLLVLDVDGVLTSGHIYYGSEGFELKSFHVHDGLGISLLQKTGVMVAIISAKQSEAVIRRIKDLNIAHAFLGQDDKLPAYEKLKQTLNLTDEQIAYMGDDLLDIPLLRRAGLAITVPQAPKLMHEHVDFTTAQKAGKGAVREVCDFIMESQGTYESVIQFYLTK